jgi:putative chitinase
MDRKTFFDHVRGKPFSGALDQSQVAGLNTLLDAWEKHSPQGDTRWLAYDLGTAFHETAHTMQPVREIGHGAGRAYGSPDQTTGKVYYGRGYVQLTWKSNYLRLSPLVGVDLVADPDHALNPDIAATILFVGMERGLFTGKKLADFFNDNRTDWVNARRIVNALDRAGDIARYAEEFHAAIMAATEAQRAESGAPAAEGNKSMDQQQQPSVIVPHLPAVPDVPTTGEGFAGALSQLHQKLEGLAGHVTKPVGLSGGGASLTTILLHSAVALAKQYNVPARVDGYIKSFDVGTPVAGVVSSLAGKLPSGGMSGLAMMPLRGILQNPNLASAINGELQSINFEKVLNDGISALVTHAAGGAVIDLQANKPSA